MPSHQGQPSVRALSYSTCITAAVVGVTRRGVVQSVFHAAANIIFTDDFILALTALNAPRVPNGLQLSVAADTFPLLDLRVGLPVLLGAQRLHIEAVALSLDLTYCQPWNPSIVRPATLDMAIIERNRAWVTRSIELLQKPPWLPVRQTGFLPEMPLSVVTSLVGVRCSDIHLPDTIQAMAQMVCGRGRGLTPSGDDILAGWMALNWLLHGPHPRLLAAYQYILTVAQRQTHLLSQCWLRYAAQGYVAEPIGLLLQALTHENEVELAAATQAVLALGATSGHDILCGILLGLAGTPSW